MQFTLAIRLAAIWKILLGKKDLPKSATAPNSHRKSTLDGSSCDLKVF
jgi:hypothetical protein